MKKTHVALLGLFIFVIYLIAPLAIAEEEPFYPGVYYVGKDFKAGSYIIHLTPTEMSDHPIGWLHIYDNEEQFKSGDDKYKYSLNFSVEGCHLVVSDGMVFELKLIVGFGGKLTISHETPSWMIENN